MSEINKTEENKLEEIKRQGFSNLQFVLDFDRTITGPVNKEPAPPIISFLRNSDILGEEYKKIAQANFAYYYPFEKSHEISLQEKSKLMHEWWSKHLNLLVEFGLSREKIEKIVSSEDLILRAGVKELIEFANNHNVPIIIFSASILGSESIRLFFTRHGINPSNLIVITNELTFDPSGKVNGFKEPIIHSENKDESILDIENISQRKNTILAGDGLGDIKMVKNKSGRVVYRVGISDNLSSEENNKFLEHFDNITNDFHEIIQQLK